MIQLRLSLGGKCWRLLWCASLNFSPRNEASSISVLQQRASSDVCLSFAHVLLSCSLTSSWKDYIVPKSCFAHFDGPRASMSLPTGAKSYEKVRTAWQQLVDSGKESQQWQLPVIPPVLCYTICPRLFLACASANL